MEVAVVQFAYSHQLARQCVSKHRTRITSLKPHWRRHGNFRTYLRGSNEVGRE
jgi:hypothetical protein